MNYTVEQLRKNNLIIFESVMGSRAYGTNLPTSDYDTRGVFVQPTEDIIKYGYVEQVSEKNNDVVFYEVKRFLELLVGNNPNIMELLNAPEDMVVYRDVSFDLITDRAEEFVTKRCKNTFGGYAVQQIKKARGLNKKMNWDENEMQRKGVLDFCYILDDNRTIPFTSGFAMDLYGLRQEDVGLCKLDHARDLFCAYDLREHDQKKGIVKDLEKSNDVQIVSIPKGIPVKFYMLFNKDAYSTHCKKYKEYTQWLEERNEDRFKMNKEHGKNYDSKNMMHTMRLLNTAIDIATKKEIVVRRPEDEIEVLMKIRRGEYDYEDLLNEAEAKMVEMDNAFDESDLPMTVDGDLVPELLENIRKLCG